MATKKTKKEKRLVKTPTKTPKVQDQEIYGDSNDTKMDFGGLPDRDLKKNLGGCG